ncbi:MAG: glycoside hydrolase family 95 protein, partial [Clostridiales bacterium]|nr:glycoside hydrolase family 95 protein [Clostridiales bacterium]
MKLWYKSPAETWIDCLPLGNGKLGVMTDGGVFREKLYLNEDTLWSGYPTARDRGNPDAGKNLSKIREAVLKGRLVKADALLRSTSLGEESTTYLPLGTVVIDYKIEGQITDYSRELSLDRALAVSAFTNEQNRIEKRIFCSYPDKIVVMNIRSVRKISFDVTFQAALECTTTVEKNLLFAAGHAPETVYSINPLTLGAPEYGGKSMAYSCGVKVITDGKLTDGGEAFTVEDATDTLIVISAATGFRTFDEMPDTDADAVKSRVAALLNKKFDFDYLFERHLSDYTSLFKRVNLKLKRRLPNAAEYEDLPTDELLAVARKGTELPNALVELYYHYGRYLMIASSRTGSEPTTLQGLWNKDVKPAWNSNYTVNINTQMNYWAAGSSNLYECAEPFRRFVKELAVSGKKTAEQNLNASGFAAFHNSDLWRKTTPAKTDPVWAYFPMAGAWLANEVYSAYTYSAAYLSAKKDAPETREVLELLQSACAFLSDWLIPYKGCYITCPSTSPEHKFVHNLFFKLSADYASAIDMSIAWQLIENYKELCGILGIENRLLYELSEKQIKLFSLKSGKNGLLEWHTDYTPTEAGHRHFSPLYCLYPGNRVK